MRVRQQPGWGARVRGGRCEIRVWVDNRAEVRMRKDTVFVRTLEGSKGRDEGSSCSQALPLPRGHPAEPGGFRSISVLRRQLAYE